MESDRGRYHWMRTENEELMFCYQTSRPNVRGFRKRLYKVSRLWKSKFLCMVPIITGALGSVSIKLSSYIESLN